MTDRLYRSRDDRMLAGVAGGLAETMDVDPSIVRVVWALLMLVTGGIFLVIYIVMAIVVPEAPEGHVAAGAGEAAGVAGTVPGAAPDAAAGGEVPPGGWLAPDGSVVPMAASAPAGRSRRTRRGDRTGGVVAGTILILIGGIFLVRQLIPEFDLGLWWPVAAIAAGILLVVMAVMPSRRSPD